MYYLYRQALSHVCNLSSVQYSSKATYIQCMHVCMYVQYLCIMLCMCLRIYNVCYVCMSVHTYNAYNTEVYQAIQCTQPFVYDATDYKDIDEI